MTHNCIIRDWLATSCQLSLTYNLSIISDLPKPLLSIISDLSKPLVSWCLNRFKFSFIQFCFIDEVQKLSALFCTSQHIEMYICELGCNDFMVVLCLFSRPLTTFVVLLEVRVHALTGTSTTLGVRVTTLIHRATTVIQWDRAHCNNACLEA